MRTLSELGNWREQTLGEANSVYLLEDGVPGSQIYEYWTLDSGAGIL